MAFDIVQREGGYVNDSADKGGPTNHGITLAVAKKHGYSDVQQITVPIAEQIMIADYFTAPGFDKLPAVIQPQMFDIAVNSGAGEAVKLLQHALVSLGGDTIVVDGVLGPKTIEILDAACSYHGEADVDDAIVDARIAFYRSLVAADPAEQQFLNGWTARAKTFEMVKGTKLVTPATTLPITATAPPAGVQVSKSVQVVSQATAPAPACASASRWTFEALLSKLGLAPSLV
jgi:lysozyme family protein